jgi:transcriptional regulator with XRE-family HTH domain
MTSKKPGETLGSELRDARIAAGHSLRSLANKLDLSPSYLNDIEHNRRIPSESVLVQIADELDLDADHLLSAAGRVGEGAGLYLKANPTAGVLFRRVSAAGLPEEQLKRLLEEAEQMIGDRDKGEKE